MGFLRRLIGGPSEREVPTAPAVRPMRELEDHRTPTLEGGLDLVPGIGGRAAHRATGHWVDGLGDKEDHWT